MNAYYEAAKRVALGLEKEAKQVTGSDIWNVSMFDIGVSAEMPFQFFERGFEATDEQQAQKAVLKLYEEEYAADCALAAENLASLRTALSAGDATRLKGLLSEAPLENWLSLVFLDGNAIKEELAPALSQAGEACRTVMADALQRTLDKLVDFKALPEALKHFC